MKIKVDRDLCQGHGRCVIVAPELFAFADGEDQAHVFTENVPAESEALAERAARACPERAVIITK